MLGIYGENDERIDAHACPTSWPQMQSAGKTFTHEVYPGTGHGFLKPGRQGSRRPAGGAGLEADPRVLPRPARQVRPGAGRGGRSRRAGACSAWRWPACRPASPPRPTARRRRTTPTSYDITLVTSDTGAPRRSARCRPAGGSSTVEPVEHAARLRVPGGARAGGRQAQHPALAHDVRARRAARSSCRTRRRRATRSRPASATTASRAAAFGSGPTAPARARSPGETAGGRARSGCRCPTGAAARVTVAWNVQASAGPARGGERRR